MEWKKDYELGEEIIDNQHKKLVNLIKEYNITAHEHMENISKAEGEVLTFLINYTKYHFEYEESYMEKINYPEIQSHKQKHIDLVNELRTILLKLKNGKSFTHFECYNLLMNWLNDHILDEDKKIAKFISGTGYNDRIILDKPEQYLKEVKDELNVIDTRAMAGGKTAKEKDIERMVYLDLFMDKFIYIESSAFLKVLKFLELLSDEDLITVEERQKLYYDLDLEGKYKKNELLEPGYDFSEIKEILNKLRMD